MTKNLPQVPSTAVPMDMMLAWQRTWMESSANWLKAFGAVDNRRIDVSIRDINIFYPFGSGFSLFANPVTSWFDMMATGEPDTERRIVTGVASYGKQLGWIIDTLLPIAEESDEVDPEDLKALRDLKDEIEAEKARKP